MGYFTRFIGWVRSFWGYARYLRQALRLIEEARTIFIEMFPTLEETIPEEIRQRIHNLLELARRALRAGEYAEAKIDLTSLSFLLSAGDLVIGTKTIRVEDDRITEKLEAAAEILDKVI